MYLICATDLSTNEPLFILLITGTLGIMLMQIVNMLHLIGYIEESIYKAMREFGFGGSYELTRTREGEYNIVRRSPHTANLEHK